MTTQEFKLPASQRLKSRSSIDRLFTAGKGGIVYPVRYLVFDQNDHDGQNNQNVQTAAEVIEVGTAIGNVSVIISVSKRYHKRAVARNLLKRRMREAYRLNKSQLVESVQERGACLSLGLIYVSKDIMDYKTIESVVKKIILRLVEANVKR